MKNGMSLAIATSFLLLFQGGCGRRESSDLSVGFTVTQTYAIDATATSCSNLFDFFWQQYQCNTVGCSTAPTLSEGGVPGPYLRLGNLILNWEKTTPLQVIYIRFTFKGNILTQGTYSYTLSNKELWSTWRRTNRRIPTNPTLPADYAYTSFNPDTPTAPTSITTASPTSRLSECTVQVPSLPIKDKKTSGSVSGQVFVYAVEMLPDGSEIPVFANSSVSFTWLGIQ
jgi:hypothetical protein